MITHSPNAQRPNCSIDYRGAVRCLEVEVDVVDLEVAHIEEQREVLQHLLEQRDVAQLEVAARRERGAKEDTLARERERERL